jgi:hypothetical protein
MVCVFKTLVFCMLVPFLRAALFALSASVAAKMAPGVISSQEEVFLSSVVLLVSSAYVMVLGVLFKILNWLTGVEFLLSWDICMFPLTIAMAKEKKYNTTTVSETRHIRQTDVFEPGQTPTVDAEAGGVFPSVEPRPHTRRGSSDVSESDSFVLDGYEDTPDEINVYTDVYMLGLGIFVLFYCIDLTAFIPSVMFLVGLTAASTRDVVKILRGSSVHSEKIMFNRGLVMIAYLLSVCATLCAFASIIQLQQDSWPQIYGSFSLLTFVLSFVLPVMAPALIMAVQPKTQPSTAIKQAMPFVALTAAWFIGFYLAIRGRVQTIVNSEAAFEIIVNGTSEITILNDLSTDKASVPYIMLGPIVKIPVTILIMSAIINRQNIDVLTPLALILYTKEYYNISSSSTLHDNISKQWLLGALSLATAAYAAAVARTCKAYVGKCLNINSNK